MGTYTTNKNLFMPTVGEQGWGALVNGNFETIDNFLKPITVSGSTYTFTGNQTGGSVSATNITNSGTLTNTGKITANGGIGTTTLTASSTSTFTGKLTANGGIGTKALTTTSISNSGTLTQTGTSTFTGKITANGGIGTKALTATTGTFSGAVTADTITANNLSFSGDLCTIASGDVISGLYTYQSVHILTSSVAGNSKTFTYQSNPICNTIRFYVETYYGNAYVKVNGTTVCSASSNDSNLGTNTSEFISMNDGDTIVCYAKANSSPYASSTQVYVRCGGYLVSS